MGKGGEYAGIQLIEGFEKLIANKPLNEKKPGLPIYSQLISIF